MAQDLVEFVGRCCVSRQNIDYFFNVVAMTKDYRTSDYVPYIISAVCPCKNIVAVIWDWTKGSRDLLFRNRV